MHVKQPCRCIIKHKCFKIEADQPIKRNIEMYLFEAKAINYSKCLSSKPQSYPTQTAHMLLQRLVTDFNELKLKFQESYKKFGAFITEMKMELKDGTQEDDRLTESLVGI